MVSPHDFVAVKKNEKSLYAWIWSHLHFIQVSEIKNRVRIWSVLPFVQNNGDRNTAAVLVFEVVCTPPPPTHIDTDCLGRKNRDREERKFPRRPFDTF
jgi:hypothetical protein